MSYAHLVKKKQNKLFFQNSFQICIVRAVGKQIKYTNRILNQMVLFFCKLFPSSNFFLLKVVIVLFYLIKIAGLPTISLHGNLGALFRQNGIKIVKSNFEKIKIYVLFSYRMYSQILYILSLDRWYSKNHFFGL